MARVHSGPCIEALRDEEDTDDPSKVTCPDCLARMARVRPLTWAQRRHAQADGSVVAAIAHAEGR